MKQYLCALFAVPFAISMQAQVVVGGHQPFYDEATQSFLYVTSESSLSNLTASVSATSDGGWQDLKIDGNAVGSTFNFGDASADRTYQLTATAGGKQVTRTIRFTCLPVFKVVKSSDISKDYSSADIYMDAPDGSLNNTRVYCQIKTRGGTTNRADRHKRNYRFNITDSGGTKRNLSLLGMREDNGWILDAGQVDVFRVRNKVCHEMWLDFSTKPYYFSKESGAVNGCHTKEIELFINNEYRGMYDLMEPLDRKQLALKKYKKGNHGLLYKASDYEGTTFYESIKDKYSNKKDTWSGWEVKYPEPGDDADTTDFKPLKDFIDFVATSSDADFKENIAQKMDLPVFEDWVLFIQLLNAPDNVGKNCYWSVYDYAKKGYTKFVLSPWDLDATFGTFLNNVVADDDVPQMVAPTHEIGYVTNIDKRMSEVFGDEYTKTMNDRYAALRSTTFSYQSLCDRFQNAYEELRFSGAANREQAKWSGDTDIKGHQIDWESELSYIKNWISQRLNFVDPKYNYTSTTGITTVNDNARLRPVDNKMYNLQGQQVGNSYKGIVIVNGKKIIKR